MTAAVHVRDARDLVLAERSTLVVVGRALTPLEKARLASLERAVDLLTEVLAALEPASGTPPSSSVVPSGRFAGATDEIEMDLRVDAELGVISGDISAVASQPGTDEPVVGYSASFRTAPGERVVPDVGTSTTIIAEDDLGGTAQGSLRIGRDDAGLTCSVELERTLNGLPGGRPLRVGIEHRSHRVRGLAIEIYREQYVEPIGAVPRDDGGQHWSLESALNAAGFDTTVGTSEIEIPPKPEGWDTAELHALMVDVAERPVDRVSWDLGLLTLSRADARHPGLLGVMFDTTPRLPRQAAAVFAETIRERRPHDAERKLLQTTVHELGHALNLAHRFEREVGRADSFSHMAYDWRHVDGPDAFWRGYEYTFDRDELEFMRHARRRAVIPGGAPFRSIRYWADGDGGYSPYVPESPMDGVSLRLDPAPASASGNGAAYQFGQPVFLQVTLQNNMHQPIEVAPQILDHKVGLLEILIRRHRPDDPSGLVGAEPFVPIVQRCLDVDLAATTVLPPGGSLANNLNLTFGASGFGFAEPGRYEVTALLAVPEVQRGRVVREFVAAARPLPVRVDHPTSVLDSESVEVLLDPEVGAWFALGGSPALAEAGNRLTALVERRGNPPDADPVVAAIVRSWVFGATRRPVRFDHAERRFTSQLAAPEDAAELLSKLGESALAFFDDATASSMRRLAADYLD